METAPIALKATTVLSIAKSQFLVHLGPIQKLVTICAKAVVKVPIMMELVRAAANNVLKAINVQPKRVSLYPAHLAQRCPTQATGIVMTAMMASIK
jgi:hypothetical protein